MVNHAETTKAKLDAEAKVKLEQAKTKIDKAVVRAENNLENLE